MSKVKPKTAIIFMILEPIILPITKSFSLCFAAARDAASSGSDVPSATMDIPITKDETPNAIAIPFAPKTKIWAPNPSPIIPKMIFSDIVNPSHFCRIYRGIYAWDIYGDINIGIIFYFKI